MDSFISLKILLLTGKSFTVRIKKTDTISLLLEKIHNVTGFDTTHMRLYKENMYRLYDWYSISEYDINDGDTIKVLHSLGRR